MKEKESRKKGNKLFRSAWAVVDVSIRACQSINFGPESKRGSNLPYFIKLKDYYSIFVFPLKKN